MKTKDFDYYLPEELIAQTPLEKRDESRLMCLDKETGELSHHHFYELPDFLNPGDCLILNNSRVLPARLLGQRLPGGGACEVLLLIDRGDKHGSASCGWQAPAQGRKDAVRQRRAQKRRSWTCYLTATAW